jgi:hypothetical protein
MAKSPDFEDIEKVNLNGKNVMITGANSGLGYDASMWFAKHGGFISIKSELISIQLPCILFVAAKKKEKKPFLKLRKSLKTIMCILFSVILPNLKT